MDISTTSSIGSGLGSGSDLGDPYDLDSSSRSARSSSVGDSRRLIESDNSTWGTVRYWLGQVFTPSL
jgi:hypothetical protein